ncbi:hypothetical protein GPECTOR_1g44 [Gonium pectorale]|uniref:Ankyrin repeat domain-containing protein n=1 Tax=Gonium pectorale TaxID=33097 RepID=A0A150H339_GONPE|nr:hypothetical protein GPECTOR_1g44 [Gonium pectorale]|eukprot:KXZ56491.1 hypothetical protein GPECTOR_1g44 [Gonium pectorale]
MSGSVELMAWLRERGCEWGGGAFVRAAGAGCEEALEWLAERGCPMPDSGRPYVAACRNGDLAAARCLARLGVPWGPPGAVFGEALYSAAPLPLLRWLLGAGCPLGPRDAACAQLRLQAGLLPPGDPREAGLRNLLWELEAGEGTGG